MTKYETLIENLTKTGTGQMKCFGSSMMPIIKSGSLLTFVKQPSYAVGDIVFCKVKGRFIDAHLIKKVGTDGRYLIANKRGFENGWTHQIFGKVTQAEYGNTIKNL